MLSCLSLWDLNARPFPRIETREIRPVDPESQEKAWTQAGLTFARVGNTDELLRYLFRQGLALISKPMVRLAFPMLLESHQVLPISGGSGPFLPLHQAPPCYRRRSPTARQRQRILARDGNSCTSCGSIENLEIDHIRPWHRRGFTFDENLRTLCRRCHAVEERAKKGRHYSESPGEDEAPVWPPYRLQQFMRHGGACWSTAHQLLVRPPDRYNALTLRLERKAFLDMVSDLACALIVVP